MKTKIIFLYLLVLIACKNTAEIKSVESNNNKTMDVEKKGRVTGIGGIFFKCKDPNQMKDWYSGNLGLKTDEYGSMFEFRKIEEPYGKAYLQWSPFSEKTKYFEPSQKDFMINYRVENIELLINDLKLKGIVVLDSIESYDYGKFVHILDPEGNKIELWEPIDNDFSKSSEIKITK